MHDHAGRVQDAAQARAASVLELCAEARDEVAGVRAGADLLARAVEHAPRGVDGERVVDPARELVDRREVSQLHRRKDRALPLAGPCETRSSPCPRCGCARSVRLRRRRPARSSTRPARSRGTGSGSARARRSSIDGTTGKVLWAKRAHVRRQIASTTKIMTALVAMARLGPHSIVTVDRAVRRVPPITEGLRPGERVEAWKLLYGLLLFSGNDDALALAVGAGGTRSRFVALMNEKAQELGLTQHALPQPERPARPRQLLDRVGHGRARAVRALESTLPRDRPHADQARARGRSRSARRST